MRTENRNKQSLKYARKGNKIPIYEKNADGSTKTITIDGVSYPVETGDYTIGYSVPVGFLANISMSGGESVAVEYGLDYSSYDAIIVTAKGELPIKEADLIWHTSSPTYKDAGNTIVNENSADYRVVRVKESLNASKYILSRIVK